MSVIHIEKRDRWAPIANTVLEDVRLSFKARGILAYLLSKPDDWETHISELCAASKRDGEKAIRTALDELTEWGYATFARARSDGGRFVPGGWIIREQPSADFRHVEKRHVEKRHVEKRHVEKRHAENRHVYQRLNIVKTEELPKTEEEKENSLPSVESFAGNETALIPSPPVPTTKTRAVLKKTPLAAGDWLGAWLQQQDLVPWAFLNDERWWAAASKLVTDGFDEAWLEHEFALIVLFFQKPGERAPTTEAGWKRFLTHWFQVADKKEQRAKRQEKHYGA